MKKLLLIIALLSLLMIFAVKQVIYKYAEPVPAHDDSVSTVNEESESVIGFQIADNGEDILYLTVNDQGQNIYAIEGNAPPRKINKSPIPARDPESLKVSFARTFVDIYGNVYFDSDLHLIRIAPELKLSTYVNLDDSLLHTQDELTNKTNSKLFKRIINKYSAEQIVAIDMYNDELHTYLVDLDGGYYITTKNYPLKLERLPLEGETVSSVTPDKYLSVRYQARWDPVESKMNNKADIDTITETVSEKPVIFEGSKKFSSNLTHMLRKNRTYKIDNGEYKAEITNYCYPAFMPIDMPSCRGERIFLKFQGDKVMLPNPDESKPMPNYDSSFIYIPYDNRYITSLGMFVFLSQDHNLYLINKY